MAKSQLKVATIVGSQTDTAWSQTYHAGGVTAVVSVQPKEGQEASSLSLVGKDLLNTFESEYFTLETKNLASIKEAVELTYQKSKDTHAISLIVSSVIQNAVYLVLAGPGKITLIRNTHMATLLEQEKEDVLSASGFLEPGDRMVLETMGFDRKVSATTLLDTLSENSVTDAAEILSPTVHQERDGSLAAVLFSYEEEQPSHHGLIPPVHQEPHHEVHAQTPSEEAPALTQEKVPQHEQPIREDAEKESEEQVVVSAPAPVKKKKHLTHRQKIFLTIAVILAVVFVGAIYFSLQKKQTAQNSALFEQVYQPAERKYEEAQGLQDLNAALAHDDYVQAQQMLAGAKNKFPQGSSEQRQILALLDKVNSQLQTNTLPTQTTSVAKVDSSADAFLAFAQKHSSATYFAQDGSNFYLADATGITKFPATGTTGKQIIQNSGDWKSLAGFQTYLGNMYVLDSADGIDKYPVAATSYGSRQPYFTGTTPNLTKAVSLAIDSDVWILTSDGTITKYTRGSQQPFTVTGLVKPLASPTQITTTPDDTNLYILDNGNSRVVVLKKDGTFVAEYANAQLKSATQLDINETAKKAYFLSGSSLYEFALK